MNCWGERLSDGGTVEAVARTGDGLSGAAQILVGDCVEVMAGMPADAVDAIVTDPPYGLTFMGRGWDRLGHGNAQQAWHALWTREAYRVMKPGGHLLAFGGTRTYHRMVCAIEDAGFEIRDRFLNLGGGDVVGAELPGELAWVYGSG